MIKKISEIPPNITPAWQVARPEPLFGPDFNPISGRKRDRNLERRLHTNFAICFLLFLPLNFLNLAFLSPLKMFVILPFKVFFYLVLFIMHIFFFCIYGVISSWELCNHSVKFSSFWEKNINWLRLTISSTTSVLISIYVLILKSLAVES